MGSASETEIGDLSFEVGLLAYKGHDGESESWVCDCNNTPCVGIT